VTPPRLLLTRDDGIVQELGQSGPRHAQQVGRLLGGQQLRQAHDADVVASRQTLHHPCERLPRRRAQGHALPANHNPVGIVHQTPGSPRRISPMM
jgi:hypothetical protein